MHSNLLHCPACCFRLCKVAHFTTGTSSQRFSFSQKCTTGAPKISLMTQELRNLPGISQDTPRSAALMTIPAGCIETPFHSDIKSSTIGFRKVLILPFGSAGPGITPNIIIHLFLKRSLLDKLRKVIMMTETLYSERLKGLNQSTLKSSSMLLLSHSWLRIHLNNHICPSKISCISLVTGSDISLGAQRSLLNVSSLSICFSH